MVKISIAVFALISSSDAIKTKNRFIVGDFDDDQAVIDRVLVEKKNAEKTARDFDNNIIGVNAMESTQKHSLQSIMQVRSDPIESSVGHDDLPKAVTEEQKYEEYLRSLKP